MSNTANIGPRKKEIRSLIARANFEQAFKRLIDFSDDFANGSKYQNEVIVVCAEFNSLEDDQRVGLLDYNLMKQQRNQIIFRVLKIIDKIYSDCIEFG